MPTWSSHLELELACQVGAVSDALRALEEGADPDAEGGSPLFICIMRGHREVARLLLEKGADAGRYLSKSTVKQARTIEELLDALMAGTPPPPPSTDTAAALPGEEVLEDLDQEAPQTLPALEE